MSTLPVTEKTIRNLLTTITVFAIATTVLTASSFAAEFTVHEGKRYQAILKLTGIEQLAENALIARKFTELGFSGVRVSGAGATRRVEGVWPRKDIRARMPPQIVRVAEL